MSKIKYIIDNHNQTLSSQSVYGNLSATTFYGDGSHLTGIVAGAGAIPIAYSELVDNINSSVLTAGATYIITDFQTCYDVPEYYVNGQPKGSLDIDYRQSNVEPIVVFATSANTISSTAYQPAYPNDRIQYDWTFSSTPNTGNDAFGRITERIDEFNNRTDYDHRNISFNRFRSYNKGSQLTGVIDSYDSSTGVITGNGTLFLSEVEIGDILFFEYQGNMIGVKVTSGSSNTLIIVVVDPSFGSTINFTGELIPFYSSTSTGNYYEYKEVYVGQKISEDWNDYLTFNLDGSAIHNYVGDYSKFYLNEIGSNSGFLLANNVFYGNRTYSNTIGDRSYNNTGTYWFSRNTIAGRFYNNVIYNNGFYSNSIGEYFNNNIVKSSVYGNVIKQGFEGNEIYSQFYDNDIDNGFYNNKIYSSFYQNKIGLYFELNNITQQFYRNEIGYGFNNNQISGETYTNRIGEQFENNTIYSSFYDNQIFNEFKGNITYQSFYENRLDWGFGGNQFSGSCAGNSFGPSIDSNDFLGSVYVNIFKGGVYQNTFGDNFTDNNIGFGFNNNTIGENFGYGGSSPQGNIIGNNFYNNTIGEYFYNNSIADNFKNNEVGNYFQWNVINANIDHTYFTLNYGNITGFSYTTIGRTATDDIYTNLSVTTNGGGTAATFNVEVSGGTVIGVSGNTEGRLYSSGNTLTMLGTQIDGVTTSGGIIYGFSSDGIGKNGSYGVYNNLPATGGTGTDATFNVSVSTTFNLVYEITLNNPGSGYTLNDELVIVGSLFGGVDGVDDITITVSTLYSDDITITVTGVTSASLFYENYTKQIFERRLGDKRILFYDEDDVLNIDSVYIISGYIPVYSQNLTFPYTYTSFDFWCDGGYVNGGGTTNQTVTNSQELVTLFNNNFRQFGYFFDSNDGKIGLYIDPILKQINCPSGTYTINVFND